MAELTIKQTVDRSDAVRELAKTYPAPLRGLAFKRYGHMAHLVSDGRVCLEYSVRASDVLEQWAFLAQNPGQEMAWTKALPSAGSSGFFDGDGGEGWAGMGCEQYAREIKGETRLLQARLEVAQRELQGSGLKEALEELAIGSRKRRKRAFSDTEGSFEYDRRDEDFCMSRMVTRKKEFPFIELCYPIGMNCTAKASEISEFNARCMALAEILEGIGYRVSIVAEVWSRNEIGSRSYMQGIGIPDAETKYQSSLVRIPIREANDYGDIMSYAPIACAEFFRRALFFAHYYQAHHAHGLKRGLSKSPASGYGQALDERPIPASQGQLILDQKTVDALFSTNKSVRDSMFRARIAHTIGLGIPEEQAS